MREESFSHKESATQSLVLVRGGGDLASGTIHKLYTSGFPVLVLETEKPSAIRRNVAFSEAVYQGRHTIEGVTCYLAKDLKEAKEFLQKGRLTMLVDPSCSCLEEMKPQVVVDAILAKKNLGTRRSMAPVTIGLGPGFSAGEDVDAVIETMRGHTLGKVIYDGAALPNTGIPGKIAGFDKERVIYSPAEGVLYNVCKITDTVKKGDVIAVIETADGRVPVKASIDGLLRGLIRDGFPVTEGFKIADIDPRIGEYQNCFTVSDKARCIAGGVLEAILFLQNKKNFAVVGSGGKTSLIHKLAEEYREQGKKVFVTTSTHMAIEPDTLLTDNADQIIRELETKGYVMAGLPEGKRIHELSKATYEKVCRYADVVLVEADGSNRLPVKFPNATEPVIYENCKEILIVCAPHAIGKPLKEVAFRKELVLNCLQVAEEEPLRAKHIQKLVREGYLKPLGARYSEKLLRICPAHLDTPEQREIARMLAEDREIDD